jgi:hypothetical protein
MTPVPSKSTGRESRQKTRSPGAGNAPGRGARTMGTLWRQLRIERLRITDRAALHPVVRDLL